MKRIMMIAAVLIASVFYQDANAQLKVHVNINLGQQPVWGPAGYDYVDYYYLPDIDCYYDVNSQQFIYYSGNRWLFARQLPGRYRNYNLYNSYKVVVNEPRPYLHADVYRDKYRDNRTPREHQVIIRDSREEKYYQVKGHPKYNEWKRNHDRDYGKRNDDNRGHGHDRN